MAIYTKEIKLNAVKNVTVFQKKKKDVAENCGITRRTLDNWIKEFSNDITASTEDLKTIELESRIKELEKENEFLKKAAAFFAKEI